MPGIGIFGPNIGLAAGLVAAAPDTSGPTVVSATTSVDGTQLIITMSEPLTANSPTAAGFVIGGNHLFGTTPAGATASGTTVTLTAAAGILFSKWDTSITVTYTAGQAVEIKDAAGNAASSFGPTAVTNASTFLQEYALYVLLHHPGAATATSSASLTAGSDLQNAAWTKTEMTATGATTATVNALATTPTISQTITNIGVDTARNPTATFTCTTLYVDIQWLCFENRANAAERVWIDIQNGAVGTTGSSIANVSIGAVGSGGGSRRAISFEMTKNGGTAVFNVRPVTADGVLTTVVAGSTLDITSIVVSQVRLSSTLNLVSATAIANATVNNQPGYLATGGLNSKPCAVGGQVALTNPTTNKVISSTEAAVLACVSGSDHAFTAIGVVTGLGDANSSWMSVATTSTTTDLIQFGTATAGNGRFNCGKGDGAVTNANAAGDYAAGGHVSEWFGTGTATSHQDNGAAADPSAAAQDVGSIAPTTLRLGSRATVASCFQGMWHAALLADSNIASGTRSTARVFLGAVYGVTVAA